MRPVFQMILSLIRGLLYTSVFAAGCATSMVMASQRLYLGYTPPLHDPLHRLVFGATLVIYNTHFLFRSAEPGVSDRMAWTIHFRRWHGLFLAIGIGLAGTAFLQMPGEVQGFCLLLGLLSFAYSYPLLPIGGGKRIREIGKLKILVLTLVWTLVTANLPLVYNGLPIGAYPFEFFLRFSLMFTLCLAFDIRDMQADRDHGIHTLPHELGIKRTRQLMDLGIVLFLVFSLAQYLRYPQPYRLLAEGLTALAAKAALIYVQKHPSDRAYLGLVDGVMLFYAGGILLTANL